MANCEENQFQPKLLCNKGNIILNEIKIPLTNASIYNLQFELNNLDTSKVNLDLLLTTQLYNLLEKVNADLIEKIYIVNTSTTLNNQETDICILLKQIAKELGVKQKFILFRSTKYLNNLNNSITYYNKDLIYEHKELIPDYLKLFKLDSNNYESLTFNCGKTIITVTSNTDEQFINVKFSIDFQITITDDIPKYMSNFIGLMFKKMFYNVKLFIDNLNS